MMALGLAAVVVALYAWQLVTDAQIGSAEERVRTVQSQVTDLKKDVVRIERFKEQMKVLEQKIDIIKKLEHQRIGPARMLDDLATVLTDQRKVWLTLLEEKNGDLTLEGGAMEHENISDFQLELQRRSKLFKGVQLQLVTTAKQGAITYLKWKLTCRADYSAG